MSGPYAARSQKTETIREFLTIEDVSSVVNASQRFVGMRITTRLRVRSRSYSTTALVLLAR